MSTWAPTKQTAAVIPNVAPSSTSSNLGERSRTTGPASVTTTPISGITTPCDHSLVPVEAVKASAPDGPIALASSPTATPAAAPATIVKAITTSGSSSYTSTSTR